MTHYFDKHQDSVETVSSVRAVLRGKTFQFKTAGGMFSPSRVDPGSILLLEESQIPEGSRVLDLGCGYGPIGISIAATLKGSQVTLCDVNARAVKYATENAKNNGVKVTVLESDGLAKLDGMQFDVILVNPPFSAGKSIWQKMIVDSKDHLVTGGTIQLVGRKSKGGDALESFLKETFGTVEVIGRGSGYRIYLSRKE